jgi:hypothetical protein
VACYPSDKPMTTIFLFCFCFVLVFQKYHNHSRLNSQHKQEGGLCDHLMNTRIVTSDNEQDNIHTSLKNYKWLQHRFGLANHLVPNVCVSYLRRSGLVKKVTI